MPGVLVTTNFENVAVAAAQDLFEVIPSVYRPISLHSLFLSNLTDVGDAAEEMLRITVRRMSGYTSGSGGSAGEKASVNGNEANGASAAIEVNNTSVATATGTDKTLLSRGWNIRAPFEVVWTPETRPTIAYDDDNAAASLVVVRLVAAPADSVTMSGELTFEVLGGNY